MTKKTLYFGKYLMDKDGKEFSPIPWIIFHKSDDELYLMSLDILDYREFNNEENNDWNESTLRKWLNTTFLDMAFTDEEKNELLEISEGEKVSLLSVDEYNNYFSTLKELKAKYTDYARNKTKNIYGQVDDRTYGFYWLKTKNTELTEADLRNVTQRATPTVYVYHITNRGVANGYRRSSWCDGVRPVIRIKNK